MSRMFFYALVMALGGSLHPNSHAAFDAFVRDATGKLGVFPSHGSVFEYFIDARVVPFELRHFEVSVPEFRFTKDRPFFQLLVPTIDTCRCGIGTHPGGRKPPARSHELPHRSKACRTQIFARLRPLPASRPACAADGRDGRRQDDDRTGLSRAAGSRGIREHGDVLFGADGVQGDAVADRKPAGQEAEAALGAAAAAAPRRALC